MSEDINQFDNAKYLNLETFKKSGKSVATPVWFVIENDIFFVLTRAGTGKVKRLRNNSNVRISPCNFRGQLKGKWVIGIASLKDPDEYSQIINSRNKKYGIQSKLASLLTFRKGKFIIISIKIT